MLSAFLALRRVGQRGLLDSAKGLAALTVSQHCDLAAAALPPRSAANAAVQAAQGAPFSNICDRLALLQPPSWAAAAPFATRGMSHGRK